jgi:hypothetical protein
MFYNRIGLHPRLLRCKFPRATWAKQVAHPSPVEGESEDCEQHFGIVFQLKNQLRDQRSAPPRAPPPRLGPRPFHVPHALFKPQNNIFATNYNPVNILSRTCHFADPRVLASNAVLAAAAAITDAASFNSPDVPAAALRVCCPRVLRNIHRIV